MAQKYKVTTEKDGLNMRSTPEVKEDLSNLVCSIPKGAIVTEVGVGVVRQADGWKYVSYNGKQGYASSQYLTPTDEQGNKNGDPDKTTPVEDETNAGKSHKAILIIGAVACVAGLALNFIM